MRGRRYRLYTICAVVVVFLLYRTLENSWALSNGADSLDGGNVGGPPLNDPAQPPPPPPPPPAGSDSDKLDDPEDPPKKVTTGGGLLGDEQDIERELELDSQKQKTSGEDAYDGSSKGSKDSSKGSSKDTYSDSTKDTYKDSSKDSSSDYTGKDSSKDSKQDKSSPDIPKVHWSDPPKDDHQLDHSKEDKEWAANHWSKPKENYPLPAASIASIPTGTPKKIPKIQAEFGTETERVKNKRLYRQGRVKGELERAWSGYRKFAWLHDELLPESTGAKDPFCGWAATLIDSLDTLWIADMRDEFDEAANAVAKIDFTFTTRSDIPVFETTIRYLGGLIAAYDVSGGAKGKYPVLLKKAVELAEVLMGIFDTPNRMPLLYYHWRPPYSSEPHRAGQVGIAELATLSMEFTRLAQLTDTAKYYDAVNRITDALVKMQKDGETDVPGLFPEKIDASGCNRTAVNAKSGLSKIAQKQFDDDDLDTAPEGYKADSSKRISRRAAIPPPGPDAEDDEDTKSDWLTTAGPALSKELDEEETRNKGRTPPLGADGSKTEWECVDQGLIPAQWGSGMYHVGGSQDSAYEYFPKQYLLLGGLESKYQKLHEDAVDAIDKHLLFRPMIKNTGDWDILFPAKLTKTGLKDPKFSTSHEIAHLTCFIGGMYGLGGKIFNRPEDIERAKQLTDGCVWAYQSTTTGLMPEFAHLADCPTLDQCKFNQTYWYELLDPSKEWREKEMAKWEDAEADRAQAAKNKEKLREQAREKAAAQDVATDQDGADYSKYSETKSSSSKTNYGSSDEKSYGSSKSTDEDAYDYKTSKDKADYSDSSYKSSKDDYKSGSSSSYKSSKYDDEGSVDSYKSSKDTTSSSSSSKDKSYDYLNSDDDDSSSSYKSSSKSKSSSSDETSDEKTFGYKSTEGKSPSYDSKDSSSYGSKDSSSYGSKDSSYGDKSKDKVSTYDSKDSSSYGSKDTTYDKSSKDSSSSSDYKSKDTTSSDGSSKDKDSGYNSKDSSSYGSKDSDSYGSSKDKVSTYDSKDTSSYGSKDSSSSYDKSAKDSSSDYKSKDSSSYGSSKDTTYDKSSKDGSSDYKSKDSSYSSSSDKDSDYDSKDSSSSYGSKVSSYGDKSSDSTSDYKSSKDSSSDSSSGSSKGSSYDKSSKDSSSSYDKSSKDSSSSYGSKDTSSYGSSKDSSPKDSTSDSKSSSSYGSSKSSYGDDSKDTTSDSSDDASWDLKPKAVAEQKFSPLAKRNGIPMPELDTAMSAPKGESGSELPDSLKKKLGKDNRWLDQDEAEVKADADYVAPPPSEPPNRKPVTHEEYVENKLEMEKLPYGYVDIATPSYLLRPEAIESVWYMYRITGDSEWMDKGWTMFEATMKATRTEYANSAIDDVMASSPGIKDSMESFWTAETLKYYYLLFSEPDLISLDEWVLNTEAHPFKRPTASSMEKVSETEVEAAEGEGEDE